MSNKKYIDTMIQRESMIGLNQIPRRYMSSEDAQAITVAWEKEENDAITKLKVKATGPCYMQQERKKANACQDAKATVVFRHRYALVAPNSLGPYTTVYTNRNLRGVNKLIVHLTQALWKQNEEREEATGYKCRYCSRYLYVSIAQFGETIYCACWKCISVIYCSPLCRDHDQQEHKMSCFLHPTPPGSARRQRVSKSRRLRMLAPLNRSRKPTQANSARVQMHHSQVPLGGPMIGTRRDHYHPTPEIGRGAWTVLG